jgi:uncharacterized protein (TIGR00255 family)
MIQSMTGYALITRETAHASLTLELRSVNSRFLDITFRVAEDLRALEPPFRDQIGTKIARGKVDCRLSYALKAAAGASGGLNAEAIARLAKLTADVRSIMPDVQPMRVSEVLNWPGVLGDASAVFDEMRATASHMIPEALAELVSVRQREGERLASMIRSRTAQIRERLKALEPQIPEAIAAYQTKLTQKLRDVLSTGDEERIRQEIAVYGIRIDVAEELSRLAVHVDEVDRVLAAGGQVGKRLDFLLQELNREANTLGSKSVSRELSDAAVELKLAIEQMREQVQNIE